jgi:cell pole-organizing protein PopZ
MSSITPKPTFEEFTTILDRLPKKEAQAMLRSLSARYGLQCVTPWEVVAIAAAHRGVPQGERKTNKSKRSPAVQSQPPSTEVKALQAARATIVAALKQPNPPNRDDLVAQLRATEQAIKSAKLVHLLPNVQRSGAHASAIPSKEEMKENPPALAGGSAAPPKEELRQIGGQ